jgi:hypothetical protein
VSISFQIEIREGQELMAASSSDCPPLDKPKDSPPAQKTYYVLPMQGNISYEYKDGVMALTHSLTREETSVLCPRDFDFVYDEDGHGCLVMIDEDGKITEVFLDSVFVHEVVRDEAGELHMRVRGSLTDTHGPIATFHDQPIQSDCVA